MIEDDVESAYGGPGGWKTHLEYGYSNRQVDIIQMQQANDRQTSLFPGRVTALVYEIEPLGKLNDGRKDIERNLKGMTIRSQSLFRNGVYDWRQVTWDNTGIPPMPSGPKAIAYKNPNNPGDTGQLIYWYEADGVILYAKSTWDSSRLKKLPPVVVDWLKTHDSTNSSSQGIAVPNWPGVRAPTEEESQLAGVVAVAVVCSILIRSLPTLLRTLP
jgi:hypothetical protein